MEKVITVLGKSTYDKASTLLYVARTINLIATENVCIATTNEYFTFESNPYEYVEGIDIFFYRDERDLHQMLQFPYGVKILDIEDSELYMGLSEELQLTETFIYTSQDRHVVDYNLTAYEELLYQKISFKLLLPDFCERSKVREKQIARLYNMESTEHLIMSPDIASDRCIFIDNGHNQSLRIKAFSNRYKQFLLTIAESVMGDSNDNKKKKIWLKAMERGK